jgi:ATP-binding cassette subfamily B protein
MVAKHYGRHYSAQTMRERAQLGKDGVSMLGIAEAAEAVGFKTVGVRKLMAAFSNEGFAQIKYYIFSLLNVSLS